MTLLTLHGILIVYYDECFAPVAQWIEHLPSKQVAGGSSPSRRVRNDGGCSSAVRVLVCGTRCRGFKSPHPPHGPIAQQDRATVS